MVPTTSIDPIDYEDYTQSIINSACSLDDAVFSNASSLYPS